MQSKKDSTIEEIVEREPFEDASLYKRNPNYDKVFGSIYWIRSYALNRIKMGLTTRALKQRMDELQTGSPTQLTLLAYSTFQNPLAIEEALHKMFGQLRVVENKSFIGEWFYGHHILYNFIWLFANKIATPSYFPEDIMMGKTRVLKRYEPLLQIKDMTYYEDYFPILDNGNLRQLDKTLILKYEKEVQKGKEDA